MSDSKIAFVFFLIPISCVVFLTLSLSSIGKLTPVWKSQPIPKKQQGPVFVTVADTYEKSIFKAVDKDVVFYVYAPW